MSRNETFRGGMRYAPDRNGYNEDPWSSGREQLAPHSSPIRNPRRRLSRSRSIGRREQDYTPSIRRRELESGAPRRRETLWQPTRAGLRTVGNHVRLFVDHCLSSSNRTRITIIGVTVLLGTCCWLMAPRLIEIEPDFEGHSIGALDEASSYTTNIQNSIRTEREADFSTLESVRSLDSQMVSTISLDLPDALYLRELGTIPYTILETGARHWKDIRENNSRLDERMYEQSINSSLQIDSAIDEYSIVDCFLRNLASTVFPWLGWDHTPVGQMKYIITRDSKEQIERLDVLITQTSRLINTLEKTTAARRKFLKDATKSWEQWELCWRPLLEEDGPEVEREIEARGKGICDMWEWNWFTMGSVMHAAAKDYVTPFLNHARKQLKAYQNLRKSHGRILMETANGRWKGGWYVMSAEAFRAVFSRLSKRVWNVSDVMLALMEERSS